MQCLPNRDPDARGPVARSPGRCRLAAAVLAPAVVLAMQAVCLGQPPMSRPGADGPATVVRVAVFVLDVDTVNSTDQTFMANVYIEARWQDPSLAAGGGHLLISLDKVWHPRLQLLNQQKTWATLPEAVEVSAAGEVIYRQRVWGSFSQPMNLERFPFDQQTLEIQVVAAGFTPEEVQIVDLAMDRGARSGVTAAPSLPDWQIVAFEAAPGRMTFIPGNPGMSAMLARLVVARHWGYYIFKVILPLCLIVIMSWTVFWIDPTEIGSNLSVAVTSVLTIVAYRFAIGESLPKISYTTRMDAFITIATVMVFLTVIQVVYDARVVKHDQLPKAQRIDRMSRLVFPVVFFALAVWALAWM